MNLDRYEKIDGREALRRLADGETVYGRDSAEWAINENDEVIYKSIFGTCVSGTNLNDFVRHKHLFVKKPFDVRQAMLDRPNEWVGAFEDRKGEWHKVGFDTESFMAIETSYDSTVKCEFYAYNVRQATEEEMYACIPIEDVPEEATR